MSPTVNLLYIQHSTPLDSTLLYFTSPTSSPFHSTLLYSTPLYFTLVHFTSLYFTSLYFTPIYLHLLSSPPLYSTSLHFASLHSTLLHFTPLYCTGYSIQFYFVLHFIRYYLFSTGQCQLPPNSIPLLKSEPFVKSLFVLCFSLAFAICWVIFRNAR